MTVNETITKLQELVEKDQRLGLAKFRIEDCDGFWSSADEFLPKNNGGDLYVVGYSKE